MLELWQSLDAAVQAHPAERPPVLLEHIDRALGRLSQDETVPAYRAVLKRLHGAWLAGELDEARLIALARRLLHGDPALNLNTTGLTGVLAGLVRSLGGAEQAQRLAGRLGVADLLAGGLGLAGGQPDAALQAGVIFLVGQSQLGSLPHQAESGRLVLRTLLVEIDRQAGEAHPGG